MKRNGLISILLGLGILNIYPQDSIVTIPDPAFLYALIEEGVDTNGDSLISYFEAVAVEGLYLGPASSSSGVITDLTGIEAFINLHALQCNHNQITSLDLSGNPVLLELYCQDNQLTSLDVSGCISLEHLFCDNNQLVTLDISDNDQLRTLTCSHNRLTNLDLSEKYVLGILHCSHNQQFNLDVSDCSSLMWLNCSYNDLTNLDFKEIGNLIYLDCSGNQLTNLDVSKNPGLYTLECAGNQLESLDITNNQSLNGFCCGSVCIGWPWICHPEYYVNLNISNMPSLYKVCTWDSFQAHVVTDSSDYNAYNYDIDSNIVYMNGSPNVYFTSDCKGNTGIENEKEEIISIYPNPTNALFTINSGTNALCNIQLTSLNGQIIISKVIIGTTQQLDLSSIKKGVYFITIMTEDLITTRKIIKL